MFTQRNSIAVPAHDVCGTRDNVRSITHAEKLHKIFSSIQDGQYLQNFQSELYLTADKVHDNIKIETVLKNLRKNKTSFLKEISHAQTQLVKIEQVKKDEAIKILQSSKAIKCTELVSKVSTILDTPNVKEKENEASIKYYSTVLARTNMHIKICEYLDDPKRGLCTQEIVKEFENAYMKDVYQQDTDQLFVISSYFTNPVHNQTIEYAIDTINNYVSNVRSIISTDSNNSSHTNNHLYRHDVEEQSLSGDSSDIASEGYFE